MRIETDIRDFWESHPCGDYCVKEEFRDDFEKFFTAYDAHRYSIENHIPKCLDAINWRGKKVLEIGLGQGADAEQIIRRGAIYSGLDLTPEAVARVTARCQVRSLPFEAIKEGSILNPTYAPKSFDIIYSHGVLHHVPQIQEAARQIAKLLKPDGELIVMMYARWSWHYLVTTAIYSRALQAAAYLLGKRTGDVLRNGYAEAIDRIGWRYFLMKNFIHHNTDGAQCTYSGVYDLRKMRRHFSGFEITKAYKRFSPPAPWLAQRRPPFESLLGFNLWVHLRPHSSSSSS